MNNKEQEQGRILFEKQIDCLIHDDKETQMALYDENLRYEFPFANDRPRLIEGRETFRTVMTPLWEEARRRGVKVKGCSYEFHATDETGLYVAVFTLEVEIGEKTRFLPFVQFIRVQGNCIIEVREYFNPQLRAEV
ncbi:MAG: hypothetical protein LUQ50_11195 [Methanospirillum sp.]|uniref:nuclear transport factor 2 family protein n=1 Tax=Methanospirillum sp. TaxID=45200 RepID=UPI0023694C2A|nr:hypothetical protein [Methanospirillum sp.]MDD1729620.1 hypothetical protein [Methanospirillum sp.]